MDVGSDIDDIKKGEIIHTNHKLEFLRFFDDNKRVCDEISGLKSYDVSDKGDKLFITKVNFELAIKKLNSFVIDYLHYVEELAKVNEIYRLFYSLEDDFLNDGDYKKCIKNINGLTVPNQVLFNKLYINYLKRCFDIAYLMSIYLQNSLNIASREIIKNIQFVNYDGFFNNLSIYRREVSNSISSISFSNFFDVYKKILGYFYTYKYLISKREQKHIVNLLDLVYSYFTVDEVIKFIIGISEGSVDKNNRKVSDMKSDFVVIRNAINKVYYLCNYSLSLKNILPKSKKDVLVDNTLI